LELINDVDCEPRQANLEDVNSLIRSLGGADAVIHEEMQTTTRLSENFYGVCASLPLKKIVYVAAAIAPPKSPDGQPSDGSKSYLKPPTDKNSYLQVKWAQDAMALRFAQEGMPVVISIPSMTFGEYDPGHSTGRVILEMANRNFPGYVSGKRNVVYAGDAGRGLVRVCEEGPPGELYLITGENLTVQQLMAKIAVATGAPQPKAIPLIGAKLLSQWQTLRYKYLPDKFRRSARVPLQ
jgi:dihydroflavonol-4-reductase